jgi:predicted phage terminase large subunit-like protein
MIPNSLTDSIKRNLLASASPAGLALATSNGQWKLYDHLAAANQLIVDLVYRRIEERIAVIEMPPRHGKSELVSHWTPTWFAQQFPDRLAGVASYNGRFARQWGRKARASYKDAWEFHGRQIDRRRDGAAEWGPVGFSGGVVAAGLNEAWTGRGLGLLVVDDPIKSSKDAQSENYREGLHDWWMSTAFTRLDPTGVAVVMNTRWHEDDLIGFLLKGAKSGDGLPVARLRLPCIAEADDPLGRPVGAPLCPELGWDAERMALTKRGLADPYWWNALYQQRPGQSGRNEWPDEYFTDDIWTNTIPEQTEWNVIAIDPSKGKDAKHGDYLAIVRLHWAQEKYWVKSHIRRIPVEKACEVVAEAIRKEPTSLIYIEGNGGHHLMEPLLRRVLNERRIIHPPIITVDSNQRKEERIARLGPHLGDKLFRFLDNADNRLLVRMLKEFPAGDYDDGPDALEMAVRVLIEVAALQTINSKMVEDILNGRFRR